MQCRSKVKQVEMSLNLVINCKFLCELVHGTKEPLVSKDAIDRFMHVNNYSRRCKHRQMDAEADAVLWTIEGIGHHIFASKYSEEIMERILKFFTDLDQQYIQKWQKEMDK